ncbi:MAG: cysteine desulfurase family protein [Marmoricola sp.]
MTAYLDHAATTPMFPETVAAMTAQLVRTGNPSSLHASGRDARRVVEESRESLSSALGCRPGELVFTSGGTEADNLAIKGLFWGRRGEDARRRVLLASAIEHHAVLDSLHWLADHEDAEVRLVGVDHRGRLDLAELGSVLAERGPEVALLSVMWANNEVGTVQPMRDIVRLAHDHGVPVHTDAVQAVAQLPVDFGESGVDAMTVTGHKLGGPYGVGALLMRRELAPVPLLHGGGQERDIRSGTLDTPSIVGFATACDLAVQRRAELAERLAVLRAQLIDGVRDVVPDVVVHGDPVHHLPGNVNLGFPGCEGDALLMLLDARGVESSTGSACNAGVPQPSHVLLAMGCSEEEARSSLRFSLGHTSTEADVKAVLEAIGPAVERARAAGSVR